MVDTDHIVKLSHELFNSSLDSRLAIVCDFIPWRSQFNDDILDMNSKRRNRISMDGNRSIAKCFSKFKLNSKQRNLKGRLKVLLPQREVIMHANILNLANLIEHRSSLEGSS